MWKTHFNSIFNNVPPADYNPDVFDEFNHKDIVTVTGDEVETAIKDLPLGKSLKIDLIN